MSPHRNLFALLLLPALAHAAPEPIPGLHNTGTAADGSTLPADATDPHYRLVDSPDPAAPGPAAYVLPDAYPIPPWVANSSASKWIAPDADQSPGSAPGTYTYRLTFSLDGFQPDTASVSGQWSSDNVGLQVRLNGSDTGQSQNGAFGQLHPFTITSGFRPGVNTLDFLVNNAGDSNNPTGLRVELSGTAEPELPPGIAPSVTADPEPTTVTAGDSATFTVAATGSLPLSYSWSRDGTPIPGADTSTLTIPSTSPDDAGTYTATVTNPWGNATSAPAALEVNLDLPSPDAATYEQPGPSSRRTGLAITEIHYHPADRPDALETEFVELYNSNPWPEPIAGFRLSGQWDYTFPEDTEIPGLGYLVVAKNPADLTAAYGPVDNLTGGVDAALSNAGGTVRLHNRSGATLLEIPYDDGPPWPPGADGAGASLVLARPSLGESNPDAWAASRDTGGSPGTPDPLPSGLLHQVQITGVLAHTPGTDADSITLTNTSAYAVNLSGALLDTTSAPTPYAFSAGTTLAPGDALTVAQADLGFDLSPAGETVRLRSPDASRLVDTARTGPLAPGTPWTRGGATTSALTITEIFYHPPTRDDDDEFVELTNTSGAPLDLSGYTFTDGIDFTFPPGSSLAPGAALVVARDRDQFLTNHPTLDPARVFGGYGGSLSDAGERLALARPVADLEADDGSTLLVPVDEVTYDDGGAWGDWADGGGSSLELVSAALDNRLPTSWRDSDESGKSQWIDVGHTAELHAGKGTADQLHILVMGKGEAAVDDVGVTPQGSSNRVSNGRFSSGTSGWTFQGTHGASSHSTAGGGHLVARATGRGGLAANRIRTDLTAPLANGSTATLTARVRWLRGHPEVLFRPKGGYIEAVATLPVPNNLGTPGDPNGALAAATDRVHDVRHHPVLPASNEPVTVTARIDNPSVQSPTLRYRIDPSSTATTLPMRDDGTGGDAVAGDGLYTAVLPGQSRRTLAAFTVTAGAHTFPAGQEALVLWGDGDYNNRFATYRIWMTRANRDAWAAREKLSNLPVPVTFVYNGDRAVYTAGALYSGSAYTSPGYNSPTGRICGYNVVFPRDEPFLGDDGITLDFPVRDPTGQREQLMYWFLDQLGLTNNYRRYVDVWVNGSGQRSRSGWGTNSNAIYEDVQQPGADMIAQWFGDGPRGRLLKGDYWHEFTDNGSRIDPATSPRFETYTSPDGSLNKARYRYIWRPRATRGSADDFSELFELVDAFASPTADLVPALEPLVDLENWSRSFVSNDLSSNWDSFGNPGMKNSFHYRPPGGRWQVMNWDYDVGLGVFNDPVDRALFEISDPVTGRLYSQPAFLRRYWRNLRLALDTFFSPAGVADVIDKKWAAFQADNIPLTSPHAPSGTGLSIPAWISARRDYLLSQLAPVDGTAFAVTTNGGNPLTTADAAVQITGTAPVGVAAIDINGQTVQPAWRSVTVWRTTVALAPGDNPLLVTALDHDGQPLPGLADTITITLSTGGTDPAAGFVVVNEIMANPDAPVPYIELHNRSADTAFDLTGWRLDGLALTVPPGTVLAPGGFLVLTADLHTFGQTYGYGVPALAYPGRLDPDGERLTLVDAGGAAVDTVRFGESLPWPTTAPGAALQLRHPGADNSHPSSWRTVQPSAPGPLLELDATWRFSQTGALPGIGWQEPEFNDASWPQGQALFFAESAPLPGPKNTPLGLGRITYYFRTTFEHDAPPAASLALSHILDDGMVGYLNGEEFYRDNMPDGPVGNSTRAPDAVTDATLVGPFTVPSPSLVQGTNTLAVEVHQNSPGSTDVVFGLAVESAANASPHATPGAPNADPVPPTPAPPLWVNEVSPHAPQPWVELYHAGTAPLDTTGLFLTDSTDDLTRWPLPANPLPPNSFTVVNLDLPTSGLIALTDGTTVLSGTNYDAVPAGNTLGLLPDGDNRPSGILQQPTPGASNLSAPLPDVRITEWLASNDGPHADPADGDFEDWFELYNASPDPADLSGFTLTDDLDEPDTFTVPDGTSIAPGAYLLVWADGEPSQNTQDNGDLHTSFRLNAAGESIGLFSPDGRAVDTVSFGPQTPGTSSGIGPDGTTVVELDTQSPAAPNSPAPPLPALAADILPGGDIAVAFPTAPGFLYQLEASPDLSPASWQPVGAPVAGDGTPASLTDTPPPGATRRFYRLLVR